jgi:riboflavin kinase / FMN adenylyltransferase
MPEKNDQLIYGLDSLPPGVRSCVLTIGNFDGVHLGHQRILATARSLADAAGIAVVVMTFEPPPDQVIRPNDVRQRLTPPDEKGRLLLDAGADWVVFAKSDRALFEMPPQAFLDEIIVGRFAPLHMIEGSNFFFGKARGGTIETLRDAGAEMGFVVHLADSIELDMPDGPTHVSSTLIRGLVAEGRIEEANRCLGRPFALYGDVIAGEGRGRMLEFPTSNIDCGDQVCPPDGIYAGLGGVCGKVFPSAISIGHKPTFGPGEHTIEAHLIGASGDFYGERLTVHFLHRLREQVRFDGPEELKEQIAKDVEDARKLYEQWRGGSGE